MADLREDHIELEIGGTLQQSIISCLQVLDQLLRQNEAAVVSSIVVAEKKVPNSFGNIVEVIGGILGLFLKSAIFFFLITLWLNRN